MIVEDGVIQLWDVDGAFLIILNQAGKKYSNQTGGSACRHPEATGFLLPFPDEMIKVRMCESSSMWEGDSADFLKCNENMKEWFLPNGHSEEAWINLKLKNNPEVELVLTYMNSD